MSAEVWLPRSYNERRESTTRRVILDEVDARVNIRNDGNINNAEFIITAVPQLKRSHLSEYLENRHLRQEYSRSRRLTQRYARILAIIRLIRWYSSLACVSRVIHMCSTVITLFMVKLTLIFYSSFLHSKYLIEMTVLNNQYNL